ncbi:regulatory LuxR family protein [Actinocorallia herbida]|uniref:Regulatory LuxR family protein n=1 Tax=Actinocorallia herbida TaxID=58109 RepID=A0A3N1CWJ7_9ACTN|nr:LuxR family transcriptional regulator [Actinocorallia herbida]ROO85667.1 regulatory LuxR family protein [Actinocorallia herbida]
MSDGFRSGGGPLLGRGEECAALEDLLRGARGGESRVLVLRGEAGVGKSALLEHVVTTAAEFRVVTATGVQAEMELPFAALHQLCMPLLHLLDALPEPQHDALGTAFGMRSGPAPDQFLIGLAVLNLLAQAADEGPLLCVVDDAQWLDRASSHVLAFVARRLLAERVVCLFAVRDSGAAEVLPGLPTLEVGGLPDGAARMLVRRVVPGPLDERVRDRILFEARGNPLALLELPRTASLGGYPAAPTGQSLAGRLEDGFQRRLGGLPADARTVLLLAAAEPLGDPALLWRAAATLDVAGTVVDDADELVDFGERVRFRHPLVRSAVYSGATVRERRQAHRALAEATDAATDPDRRAWHRAHGATRPDEDIAAELERSAERALARGGLVAAAAFLERAVGLTPDAHRRAERAFEAARAKYLSGAPEAALSLVATAEAGAVDELRAGQAETLRIEIAMSAGETTVAPALLLDAARRLAPLDAAVSRDIYLQAVATANVVLPDWGEIRRIAEAALAQAPPAPDDPRITDLCLDASVFYTRGMAEAAPLWRRVIAAGLDETVDRAARLRFLWAVNFAALLLWDDDACHELAELCLRLVRASGAHAMLPAGLTNALMQALFEGDLAEAAALDEEARAYAAAAGNRTTVGVPTQLRGDLGLAVWRGDRNESEHLADTIEKDATARGVIRTVEVCRWARSVLYNSLGEYEKALDAVPRGALPDAGGVPWAPLELIEAAVRTGDRDLAAEWLARLSRAAQASGAEWGLGLESRCRALLSEGEEADRLYREAIERLGRTRMRPDLARAHLLYGEWLRRERRRVDAREQLRTAFEMFTEIGMRAFADRAERELLATGETARKRTVETTDELTPQEAQVARLVRTGLTNKEIAARLYVSPRTVEYHLRKVFTKLGVTSRHQLEGLG